MYFRAKFPLFFFFVILLLPASVFAQTTTEAQQKACRALIQPFTKREFQEFATFITTHFQSGLPNSELIEKAIERYRLYRLLLEETFERVMLQTGISFDQKIAEPGACRKFLDEDIFVAQHLLKQHIAQVSQAKQTERLIQRYKTLNQKLDKASSDFRDLSAYFKLFSNKLPCYAVKCAGVAPRK